ncbi:MAG: HepT-like ribonuclease domain-containing protein [Chlamydiota bacterium]
MDKKDLNRLNHMLDSAKVICQHMVNKSASDLELDRLLLGGVIRELLLIGEAANAVTAQARAEISGIPWKKVIGMRNQLIHGYFDISYRIIWSTVIEDIPELIIALEKAIHLKKNH